MENPQTIEDQMRAALPGLPRAERQLATHIDERANIVDEIEQP